MTDQELSALMNLGQIRDGDHVAVHLSSTAIVEGDVSHHVFGADRTSLGVILHVTDSGTGRQLFIPRSAIVGVEWLAAE